MADNMFELVCNILGYPHGYWSVAKSESDNKDQENDDNNNPEPTQL